MKNLFLKTIAIGLFLLVMPVRTLGQEIQIKDYENGFLFNVFTIENMEERVQLASALATSDIWLCNPTDNPGELFIRPNNQHEDIPIYAEFDYLRMILKKEYKEASLLPKEEFADIFNSWAQNITNDFYNFLISDHLDRANHCMDAEPFCTTDVYNFPAINSGVSWSGPNYGCLGSSPTTKQSFWYYMRIGVAGNITIKMEASFDIDFALWGPFSNETDPCPTAAGQTGMLTASCTDCPNNTSGYSAYPYGNLHDCSFSTQSYEYAHVVNGQVGQYFILLITNWAGNSGNITFQKYAGNGETDCSILPPLVNNDGPYCVGETITLTGNAQQGATYNWSGPGGWTANGQTVTRPNCTLAMAGEYTCTIHVGSQTSSATTQVQVHARPTANFTAGNGCVGQSIQFTSTSTTNPPGQAITSYRWNFGDGQTSSLQNPTHTYTSAGSKTVTLTVGIGACNNTKTQTVTVTPQPVANAGSDQTIIYGQSAQLSGSGGAGTFNYHWDPADKVVNPNAQNTQTRPLTAQQTFTLTVTSPQGGCTDSDQVTIHLEGSAMTMSPTANPQAICEGNSSQLDAHAGGGASNITYSWTPATGLNNTHIANPIASPTNTTTYTCTATDGFTTLSQSVTVTVNHPENTQETVYICPGDTYYWHGQPYTDINDYTFDTVTAQGCEKTITLRLRHYPSYDYAHTTTAYICPGEHYTFHGHDYYNWGQYPEHLQTIHGCDSTVWLNLNVYPDYGVTVDSVSVCPEQLPYYFYGQPYNGPTEATHTDHDIHGCDSIVKLVLSVNEYYIPDIEHQYIAYDVTPSYTWPVNGFTYHAEGQYIDTLPTQYCLGIFRLDLHFMKAPEPEIIYDTVCDSHTWWVSGTPYDFQMPQGAISHSFVKSHFDDLTPYHYEDGSPCKQEYQLHLQMYKTSDHEADTIVENACNSFTWQFGHNGESETYFENGNWTDTIKSKNSLMHCDSIVTLTIRNMMYTPEPEIVCADNGIEWPHHPITATEFNVNKYTFAALDPHSTNSYINSQCEWSISKESWPISPSSDHLTCDVYAMDWTADTIWLTLKAVNPCEPEGVITQFYLKPSFYSTQEQESYPASVNIAPNPNNGQMQLRFENMEGKLNIKVYSLTGLLYDNFEITTAQAGETYDYSMKRLANGVYFFVITDGKRSVTKKVVIIN